MKHSGNQRLTYHIEVFKIDESKTIFQNEVENRALIDCGCPELWAGLSWIETHQSSKGEVFKSFQDNQTFKLGETLYNTVDHKLVPIEIGGITETVKVGIIEADIPLLISRRQLEKWETVLNFKDKTLFFKGTGKTVKLEMTSSGHLTIDLMESAADNRTSLVNEVFLMDSEDDLTYKKLKRIHRTFGHPSSGKLKRNIKRCWSDK